MLRRRRGGSATESCEARCCESTHGRDYTKSRLRSIVPVKVLETADIGRPRPFRRRPEAAASCPRKDTSRVKQSGERYLVSNTGNYWFLYRLWSDMTVCYPLTLP